MSKMAAMYRGELGRGHFLSLQSPFHHFDGRLVMFYALGNLQFNVLQFMGVVGGSMYINLWFAGYISLPFLNHLPKMITISALQLMKC